MAERLDVTGRLAEGRSAVEHTQRYVRACHAMGYQHPDLTSRPSQIWDYYDSEEGLDLHALDADCAQLRAVSGVLTDALRIQRDQVDELASAWTGPGADYAVQFLRRHSEAGNAVATETRAAAQRCESLRDNLWHLIDVKVATAIAIDDRALLQRHVWLAAADGVAAGSRDRTANELVSQQIQPYVDSDIRDEWLTTMRSTQAGVAAAYDMVTDRMATAAPVYFEIPGDLGLRRAPFQAVPSTAPVPPATTVPAAAVVTPDRQPAAVPITPATAQTPTAAPASTTPSLGDLGGVPGLSTPEGSSGLGTSGGLGGLAARIVESMEGLLGSLADGLTSGSGDSSDEDPFDEDPFDEDESIEARDKRHDKLDDKPDDEAHEVAPAAPPTAEAQPVVDKPPIPQEPSVEEKPLVEERPAVDRPTDPDKAPVPPNGESTPCQIAADKLPQAGQ